MFVLRCIKDLKALAFQGRFYPNFEVHFQKNITGGKVALQAVGRFSSVAWPLSYLQSFMVAKKLFFSLGANHPHQPHFKAKTLLNFVRANEASEDD